MSLQRVTLYAPCTLYPILHYPKKIRTKRYVPYILYPVPCTLYPVPQTLYPSTLHPSSLYPVPCTGTSFLFSGVRRVSFRGIRYGVIFFCFFFLTKKNQKKGYKGYVVYGTLQPFKGVSFWGNIFWGSRARLLRQYRVLCTP